MRFLVLVALLSVVSTASADTGPCACDTPLVRAGVFNATGGITAPNRNERISALATELPQLVQNEALDVLCINELWNPTLRSQALQTFLSDPDWHIYQPAPVEQPDCRNACSNDPASTGGRVINDRVLQCSFVLVPGLNKSCSDFATSLEYTDCVQQICPEIRSYAETYNAACNHCLDDEQASESTRNRVFRCALRYDASTAESCRFAFDGEVDATLISRYPFAETEFHPLSQAATADQPGLTSHGVSYGKIVTPSGPVHLFCAHLANAASGMDPNEAEPLNATQSQEVLDYIQSKAGGEPAVFLADTGSGPAVAAAPSGPVNAEWPANFDILQTSLHDGLSGNLDSSSQLMSVADCTFGCDANDPVYVDHIMTSGRVCHRNGGLFFTAETATTGGGPVPLSDHYGVRTDVCYDLDRNVALPGSMMLLRDRGDPSRRRSVFRMSDPSIDLTGVDPRISGATLYIGREGLGSPLQVEMPAAGWKKAAGATEYRFRSRTGPVSSARLRDGMLIRVGLKGSGAYPIAVPQGSVGVILEVGEKRFCSAFGGKVLRDNGSMFMAIRAPARASCPVL